MAVAPVARALSAPLLAIRIDNQLQLFEESHFLDVSWNIAECESTLSEQEFPSDYVAGAAARIDVTEDGQVEMTEYVRQIHEHLSLFEHETGWTVAALANWLDRKIPHHDIPQSQSSLFIHNLLTSLMEARRLEIDHLARHKFRLLNAVRYKIDAHRLTQRRQAYQSLLFGPDPAPLETSPDLCLTYDPDKYAPTSYYEGGFRWQKHLFPRVGELNGEEFDCAVYLESLEEIEVWVRNIERRPESSFWLQTSTDRFYPDFVCRLTDGRILVVEYKGADRWSNDDSKEKRALGDLWAARSNGKCLFIMPNGPDYDAIRQKVTS